MRPVTDPALLAQLNGEDKSGQPVTDPNLLAQLNDSTSPAQTRLDKVANFLQPVSDAADKLTKYMPAIGMLTGPITTPMGEAAYLGNKINEAAGSIAEPVASFAATHGASGPVAAGIGTIASIASNPLSYVDPGDIGYSSELDPAKGRPGLAARIKQTRTGVEASAFEQLRRDPTAFFSTKGRAEAGQAIGDAKQAAGINPGVTNDIKSLTPENMARARNLQGAANKAQDAVINKIEMQNLPISEPGAKVGEPHALFAYSDDFGPGGTKRDIYNVYGDPSNPAIQKRGWGSSVPKEDLDKLGIPVTGRQPGSDKFLSVEPNDVSLALDGINKRLSKLERSEGRGSPSFQKWSAIKSHFQGMLEDVAPDVRQANKEFARVALRDKFMETSPVNQSGTQSKIDSFGFTPAVVGAGAVVGGPVGAAIAYLAKAAYRSPFVAGLGTAARGLIDKVVDPALSGGVNLGVRKLGIYSEFLSRQGKKH